MGIDTRSPSSSKIVIKQLSYYNRDKSSISEAETSEVRRRFRIEAEVLEKLSNGNLNIPNLKAYINEGDEFYLVQEFIDGYNLEQLLQQKLWDEGQIKWFLSESLKILIYIHSHNVIHRDIKPSNFMFARHNDQPKLFLIDFGAVKQVIYDDSLNQSTMLIGTNGYFPPEQFAGNPKFASDIYALGMTALHLLTGKSPNNFAKSENGVMVNVDELIPFVSSELRKIIRKCVNPSLLDRYNLASIVLDDLEKTSNSDLGYQEAINRTIKSTEYIRIDAEELNSTYSKKDGLEDKKDKNNVSSTLVDNGEISMRMSPNLKAGLVVLTLGVVSFLGFTALNKKDQLPPKVATTNEASEQTTKSVQAGSDKNDDLPENSSNKQENSDSGALEFSSSSKLVSVKDDSGLIGFDVPDNWFYFSAAWEKINKKLVSNYLRQLIHQMINLMLRTSRPQVFLLELPRNQ
ncbi:serine/threonine protein kinase [Candidatus Gracilibacteria bacterium]|nr:serine/threonine protein kinase [Candidatus Gracilibacteria bacterium]